MLITTLNNSNEIYRQEMNLAKRIEKMVNQAIKDGKTIATKEEDGLMYQSVLLGNDTYALQVDDPDNTHIEVYIFSSTQIPDESFLKNNIIQTSTLNFINSDISCYCSYHKFYEEEIYSWNYRINNNGQPKFFSPFGRPFETSTVDNDIKLIYAANILVTDQSGNKFLRNGYWEIVDRSEVIGSNTENFIDDGLTIISRG